jgi:hypothetical protein
VVDSYNTVRNLYRIPLGFQRLLSIQTGPDLSASHADVSCRVFKGSEQQELSVTVIRNDLKIRATK